MERNEKFYVGQKVKITANTCHHGLEIGSVVTLEAVTKYEDGDWDLYHDGWVFDQDDCEPQENLE
ncbi:hypothetical protein [Parageobacillus toebii]|uniref:hypothetical protein n=1 Tax=Parageobacillus toebii TaxID=153151 RepID=UPI001966DEB6|nr:hypothetical protein [Parageobacillus toebii]QSB48787.1 hypothetical protein JTI59_17260 [Parageobacillus toebii]